MRWNVPHRTGFSRLGFCVCSLGISLAAAAADPGGAPVSTPAQIPASIQFTVIESKRVREGNHSVIYNRVVPPQLPVADPSATSTALTPPSPQGDAQASPQVQAKEPPTKSVVLLVSATVFNHQITELSWTQNGATYRGYSHIDFSILDGLTQFTSADTVYSLLLVLTVPGANPHTLAAPAVPSIPQLPALTPTQSDYVIVAENGQTPPDDAFTPMDALHEYFDAHRGDIATLHAQCQANLAAQAQWQKDHPVVPQDTVINFWPIRSRVYLGPASQNK